MCPKPKKSNNNLSDVILYTFRADLSGGHAHTGGTKTCGTKIGNWLPTVKAWSSTIDFRVPTWKWVKKLKKLVQKCEKCVENPKKCFRVYSSNLKKCLKT